MEVLDTNNLLQDINDNLENTQSAIKYFESEIYQMNLLLNGILKADYREHIENKKKYYETAINSLTCSLPFKKRNLKYAEKYAKQSN